MRWFGKIISIVGLAAGVAGCGNAGPTPMQVDAAQDGRCRSWGHQSGSPGYAQCRQTMFMADQQFEAEKRAAGMQLIHNMRNQPPPPPVYQVPIRPSVNCTTSNIGNTGYTHCN